MATIKDVAKLAGVSHATVSNVLNQKKIVSPKTVKKVQEAIRVLGYTPDETARSLKTSTSIKYCCDPAEYSRLKFCPYFYRYRKSRPGARIYHDTLHKR